MEGELSRDLEQRVWMLIWKQTRSGQRKHPRRMLILVPKVQNKWNRTVGVSPPYFLEVSRAEEVDAEYKSSRCKWPWTWVQRRQTVCLRSFTLQTGKTEPTYKLNFIVSVNFGTITADGYQSWDLLRTKYRLGKRTAHLSFSRSFTMSIVAQSGQEKIIFNQTYLRISIWRKRETKYKYFQSNTLNTTVIEDK